MPDFVLHRKEDITKVGQFLRGLAYEKPMVVKIKEFKKDRSLAQNRLAFKWYKERAAFFHTFQDYEHDFCKLTYGCQILLDDSDFAELYNDVIEVLPYEKQLASMKFISVTKLMNTKQFTEYLNVIEYQSANQGIVLSRPDDLYWQALGVTQ